MNRIDYANLDASKKLVDAGIVLETERYWAWDECLSTKPQNVSRISAMNWDRNIPAPSMAEVWRDLPDSESELVAVIEQFLSDTVDSWTHTDLFIEMIRLVKDVNRMVDLLIWVRKEATNGKS